MVEKVLVDVNNADEQELTSIPGIGPALARRIIQARPFTSDEDFTRVSGINYVMLGRIKPYITLAPTPFEPEDLEEKESVSFGINDKIDESPYYEDDTEDSDFKAEEVFTLLRGDVVEPPLPSDQAETSEDDIPLLVPEEISELPPPLIEEPVYDTPQSDVPDTSFPVEEPVVEMSLPEPEPEVEQVLTAPEKPDLLEEPLTPDAVSETKYVTRGQFVWIGLLILILAISFGIALSLGVLTGINGGLRYAAPDQVAALSRDLDALSNRAGAMQDTLASVQQRLDNLEALSGRIDVLESTTDSMQDDIGNLMLEVDNLDQSLQTLNEQTSALRTEMDTITEQTTRFQGVMDGLRDLLNNLFPVK